MKKLLIVEPTYIIADSLAQALETDWEITVCTDSVKAAEALRFLNPDAMIIDLMLFPQNGYELMMSCLPFLPPIIMGISAVADDGMIRQVRSLGVGYTALLPGTVEELVSRFEQVCSAYRQSPKIIGLHLQALGVNVTYSGYEFLKMATSLTAWDKSLRLHKEIYPEIVRSCKAASVDAVAKAIQNTIKAAWENRDIRVWSQYFPLTKDGDVECPANKDFIRGIVEKL